MNPLMKFPERREEMFICVEAIVNMNPGQGIISETDRHRDTTMIRKNRENKKEKGHLREEVQQKMCKRCLKMRLSGSMT